MKGVVPHLAPFLQFDHLDVLEADTGINGTFDDSTGDVHPDSDGGVVAGLHAVVSGEFVDLGRFATPTLTSESILWVGIPVEKDGIALLTWIFPNSPTYPMRFPFKLLKSVVTPEPSR